MVRIMDAQLNTVKRRTTSYGNYAKQCRTFVEQQHFSFETLWDKVVPVNKCKKEFLDVTRIDSIT